MIWIKIIVGFLIVGYIYHRFIKPIVDSIRKEKATLQNIKRIIINMNPRLFEFFCAELFALKGFKTQVTKATGDCGKDIIMSKKGDKWYVECKHFRNSKVGRPIAQKLVGVMFADNVHNGIIITTGGFTNQCVEWCESVNVKTMDLDSIMEEVEEIGAYEVYKCIRRLKAY